MKLLSSNSQSASTEGIRVSSKLRNVQTVHNGVLEAHSSLPCQTMRKHPSSRRNLGDPSSKCLILCVPGRIYWSCAIAGSAVRKVRDTVFRRFQWTRHSRGRGRRREGGPRSHQLRFEINRRQMRRVPTGAPAATPISHPSRTPRGQYDCFRQIQNDTRRLATPRPFPLALGEVPAPGGLSASLL